MSGAWFRVEDDLVDGAGISGGKAKQLEVRTPSVGRPHRSTRRGFDERVTEADSRLLKHATKGIGLR